MQGITHLFMHATHDIIVAVKKLLKSSSVSQPAEVAIKHQLKDYSSYMYYKSSIATIQHKRTTVASIFQIDISNVTIWIGFQNQVTFAFSTVHVPYSGLFSRENFSQIIVGKNFQEHYVTINFSTTVVSFHNYLCFYFAWYRVYYHY